MKNLKLDIRNLDILILGLSASSTTNFNDSNVIAEGDNRCRLRSDGDSFNKVVVAHSLRLTTF